MPPGPTMSQNARGRKGLSVVRKILTIPSVDTLPRSKCTTSSAASPGSSCEGYENAAVDRKHREQLARTDKIPTVRRVLFCIGRRAVVSEGLCMYTVLSDRIGATSSGTVSGSSSTTDRPDRSNNTIPSQPTLSRKACDSSTSCWGGSRTTFLLSVLRRATTT